MRLECVTIPCLKDNYAYLFHDPLSKATALIDAPEAAPILEALRARGWSLDEIWLTHHHWDHTDGTAQIVAATGAQVTGAAADQHRLPPLDRALKEGATFTFAAHEVTAIETPGHTIGHLCYLIPDQAFAFTGDTLMAAGCGRLFEGSAAQMHASLKRLAALPPDTLICSGHEYTLSNLNFAARLLPDDKAIAQRRNAAQSARAQNLPTVPVTLALELATNPFLRSDDRAVKQALGMKDATSLMCFTEIRTQKDNF